MGQRLRSRGEGLEGFGGEGGVGEGEVGVGSDAFDGGLGAGGGVGDGEGDGEVVAGFVAEDFFSENGLQGAGGVGAEDLHFLGDEAFGVDPTADEAGGGLR